MKALIAATCIVIIAGVTYFVVRDWSQRPAAVDPRVYACRDRLNRIATGETMGDDRIEVERCVINGFAPVKDAEDAYKSAIAKQAETK